MTEPDFKNADTRIREAFDGVRAVLTDTFDLDDDDPCISEAIEMLDFVQRAVHEFAALPA